MEIGNNGQPPDARKPQHMLNNVKSFKFMHQNMDPPLLKQTSTWKIRAKNVHDS